MEATHKERTESKAYIQTNFPSRAREQTMVNTREAAEIVPPLLYNSLTLRWPSGHKFVRERDKRAVKLVPCR